VYWSAEEFVLAAMGALFLIIVATSFLPRFELSNLSRVLFGVGAVAFVAVAWLSAGLEVVRYPPLVWILPMVPLTIIGVLVRDAIAWHPGAVPAHSGESSPGADADASRRAAFFPPTDQDVSVGEGGDGRVRALASDPEASAQELADIAFTKPQLRATVASNPATPSNVLEWLASQGDPVVHAAIKARMAVANRS
jgi:hypothetical protein